MAAKNSVRIIHFCKSIVEEKVTHTPSDPVLITHPVIQNLTIKECAFACHSQLKCPLYKSSSDI